MVWRALHALTDIAIHPRIGASGGHDFVEQLCANATRTAVGEQDAAWLQNFESQSVDVLISACRPICVRGRWGKFWWV